LYGIFIFHLQLNTTTFLEDKPLDFQQKIPLYGSNQYNLKLSPPANEKKKNPGYYILNCRDLIYQDMFYPHKMEKNQFIKPLQINQAPIINKTQAILFLSFQVGYYSFISRYLLESA